MELELSNILQLVLELVITVVLPFLLKKLFDWLNSQIRNLNARNDLVALETTVKIIRQLVQAAEMNGLSGALENLGKEKKKWVIDMAEAELSRRGINIDLDVLDALIEAQVKEAIKDVEVLFPEEGSAAAG